MRYVKKPKYNTGGQIGSALGSTATSFIPGVGPLLAPIGGMIGGMIGKSLYKEKQPEMPKNIAYGNMGYKYGGKVQPMGKGAKKFVGPKHEDGGILIDEEANPTNQQEAIAEVEGGETEQDGYIFSDTLKVPDTDMTFADAHEMLIAEGAPQEEIEQLAMMQEQMNGGSSSDMMSAEQPMEQPMEMMKDGGKVRVQSGERMLVNDSPTMSSKDYQSGTRQINFNVNGAPADTTYMYKRGLGNEAESFYYNTGDKAIDYQNTLKPNASFNTMSPDSINMFRNRVNTLAGIRDFKDGGNLLKYQDGGDTDKYVPFDPNSKENRKIRRTLNRQSNKEPLVERLKNIFGQNKKTKNLGKTYTPKKVEYNNYNNTEPSVRFTEQDSVNNDIENQVINTPTQATENNLTPVNNNNFGNRLIQNLALNKLRLDVDRVKPVSYTKNNNLNNSFKKGGYLNKFNNGGDYMRGTITPNYNLEIPKLRYSPSVNNNMYNPATAKLIATGNVNSPVVYENTQELPEITVTDSRINTPAPLTVQQSPTSSVNNNWLMNKKADSKYGLNANPMRMNKMPFSLSSTQSGQTPTVSSGPNWRNIGTGIQAATRLGAALFTPKPKALPMTSYNALQTTSPVFEGARRSAGSGFRTAMGSNPQAAYAQYLDATSNIAGQEADYRSQREAMNEQMRQNTQRTNIELMGRNQEARDADTAARMGLVAQAIDIPVSTMARDEAMKKQLAADLMISADRIEDPVERQKVLEQRYKMFGLKYGKYGGMIKRADGSYSRRGLWDNVRANKGSGKKPTKQMLEQERKIKAKG
jgi:hypothetical protein